MQQCVAVIILLLFFAVAVVFTDGRFGSGSTTSFFTNFNCSGTTGQFIDCQLESCPSSCPQALGLRCYGKNNNDY